MHQAEEDAGEAGGKNTEPGRSGVEGDGVGNHGAEHQVALEPEIDAAGLLGQRFTQRHENERGRDPYGAAQHGDQNGGKSFGRHVRSVLIFGWKIAKRP
jgi:hypothetical protein